MRKIIKSFLFLILFSSVIFSQSKYLPKTYLNNAVNYAVANFSPNASMYGITSALAVDTLGKSSSWIYWFYKPGVNDSGFAVTIIVIAGFPIPTGILTPNLPGTLLRPLGTSFCESNNAVLAAENAGGRIFRQTYPNTNILGNISKIPGSSDTSKPYWSIIYRDSVANQFQVFTIDGITCSIIPLGINISGTEIPGKIKLERNYPNPFNPKTNISFILSSKAFIVLSIFDVTGKEIENLYNDDLSAGRYSFTWNAENYPSGLYFYKLSCDNETETGKMILVK